MESRLDRKSRGPDLAECNATRGPDRSLPGREWDLDSRLDGRQSMDWPTLHQYHWESRQNYCDNFRSIYERTHFVRIIRLFSRIHVRLQLTLGAHSLALNPDLLGRDRFAWSRVSSCNSPSSRRI